MRSVSHGLAFAIGAALVCGSLAPTASASPVADAQITLSWEIWQDFNNNGSRDTGEVTDFTDVAAAKMENLSYHRVNYTDGGSDRTDFDDQEAYYPVLAGLDDTFAMAEGTGSASLRLTGASDASSLTASAHSELAGGLPGADSEQWGARGISGPLLNNYDYTNPDVPAYFTLTVEDFSIVTSSGVGEAASGDVRVDWRHQTFFSDGVDLWREVFHETFDNGNVGGLFRATSGSGSGIVLLDDYNFWPMQSTQEPDAEPQWSELKVECFVIATTRAAGAGDDPGTDLIPEPATLALLGLGLAAVARRRRRT